MPILAVDQYGEIYETSPDRADGLGYGGHAPCVCQGDLTLGASYIKANRDLLNSNMRDAKVRAEEDRATREIQKQAVAQARIKAMDAQSLLDNDLEKRALLRKAAQMGIEPVVTSPITGNPLTANGQKGWGGMDRTQQVIHHHLSGMGETVAYKVDPLEAYQAQMQKRADAVIARQAILDEKRQEYELSQARVEKSIKQGKLPVTKSGILLKHPLMF